MAALIPWLITLVTIVLVRTLDRLEERWIKSIFDWMPAILLAYLIPAAIAALLGQDYSGHFIHAISKDYIIPFAIVAVMSSLSLSQLKAIGWKPILLFVSGSFWIALFPVLIGLAFFNTSFVSGLLITDGYWKGLPPIIGSWIGGSTSQLVLKELVECPEGIFLTILVLDNILVNVWTILMFQTIKKSNTLDRLLRINTKTMPTALPRSEGQRLSGLLIMGVLVLAVFGVGMLPISFIAKIIVLSVIGLLFSNTIPNWNFEFVLTLGGILILAVMAILGLKLRFDLIQFDMTLVAFLVVWLFSHFVFMLIIARLLNINTAWVPIASMANVGGIATAPAVTAAYEKAWMPHAIILAILSMATGTFWGMLTIWIFRSYIV